MRLHVRHAVAVAVTALLVTSPVGAAAPAAAVDSTVAWSGPVTGRSLTVPGAQGGNSVYVVASFRLWIPSGGTWHVESAVTATGVPRASAPGSIYGRAGITHGVECGPDRRGADGRLTTRSAYGLTGRNLVYDQRHAMTVRTLWTAERGANRCQVIIFLGRDDLAVTGKTVRLEGGYLRLVGRGLDNAASVVAFGQPQTVSTGLVAHRFLGPGTPTITAPNFEVSAYRAPPTLVIAGNSALRPAVTHLDVIGDGYVTNCYTWTNLVTPDSHLPPCRVVNGTVATASVYDFSMVVQQFHADGALCRQTTSAPRRQSTTGAVHHQELRTHVIVAIDPTCTSRTFRTKLFVRWLSGNTFFVEAGHYLSHISIRPMSS